MKNTLFHNFLLLKNTLFQCLNIRKCEDCPSKFTRFCDKEASKTTRFCDKEASKTTRFCDELFFLSLEYRFDIIVSVYFFLFYQFLKNPVLQQEILNVLSIEKSSIEAIVTD